MSPWGTLHHVTALQCINGQLCLMILTKDQAWHHALCCALGSGLRWDGTHPDTMHRLPTDVLTAQSRGLRVINPSANTIHSSGPLGAHELSLQWLMQEQDTSDVCPLFTTEDLFSQEKREHRWQQSRTRSSSLTLSPNFPAPVSHLQGRENITSSFSGLP